MLFNKFTNLLRLTPVSQKEFWHTLKHSDVIRSEGFNFNIKNSEFSIEFILSDVRTRGVSVNVVSRIIKVTRLVDQVVTDDFFYAHVNVNLYSEDISSYDVISRAVHSTNELFDIYTTELGNTYVVRK